VFYFCSMSSAADIANEQDEGLALLFQSGLQLALQLQDDAMAAETPEERVRLATAFHRISRGVRQTAALRMKLARDAEQAGRETTAEAVRLEDRRVARRKTRLQATVGRLIWHEAEKPDSDLHGDNLIDELEKLLAADEAAGLLAEGEIDTHIARLCQELRLPSPLAGEGVSRRLTDEGSPGDRRSDPPLRGRWPEGPEGVEAHSPLDPASQPPQSRRDSSPSGGASKDDDPLLSDDYWRSSA
jgi:hypothetical protein